MEIPVEYEAGVAERTDEGQGEGDHAEGEARSPVLAQRHRIDLGTGEKGQEDRPHAGEQRGVVGLLDVLLEAGDVAGNRADEYLHQRHRDADSNADQRREKRQAIQIAST